MLVDTVKSPPSILISPSTSRLLLTFVIPVAAPIWISVAAPAKLTVVAVVLSKLKVVWFVVKSPPWISASPLTVRLSSTSRLFRTYVVPVSAPSSSVVAFVASWTFSPPESTT